jgi:hypothetical protein
VSPSSASPRLSLMSESGETMKIVQFAIPAYGALARSQIRSLEQSVELRRALLLAEDAAARRFAAYKR